MYDVVSDRAKDGFAVMVKHVDFNGIPKPQKLFFRGTQFNLLNKTLFHDAGVARRDIMVRYRARTN
jgi:hypothetical protein